MDHPTGSLRCGGLGWSQARSGRRRRTCWPGADWLRQSRWRYPHLAGRDIACVGGATARTRRSASSAIWSASASASSWSWVTRIAVVPVSRRIRATSLRRSRRSDASSALNGSSSSTTCGPIASARASETRCCWPPDSWCGYRFRSSRRSVSSSRCSALDRSRRGRPKAMLPMTVRCGNSAPSCGTYPTPRCWGARVRVPSSTVRLPMLMVPLSSRSNPAMRRSSVVLPLPDAPSTAVIDPAETVRSAPASTGVVSNRFATARSSIALMAPTWSTSRDRTKGPVPPRARSRSPP